MQSVLEMSWTCSASYSVDTTPRSRRLATWRRGSQWWCAASSTLAVKRLAAARAAEGVMLEVRLAAGRIDGQPDMLNKAARVAANAKESRRYFYAMRTPPAFLHYRAADPQFPRKCQNGLQVRIPCPTRRTGISPALLEPRATRSSNGRPTPSLQSMLTGRGSKALHGATHRSKHLAIWYLVGTNDELRTRDRPASIRLGLNARAAHRNYPNKPLPRLPSASRATRTWNELEAGIAIFSEAGMSGDCSRSAVADLCDGSGADGYGVDRRNRQ